MDKIDKVFYINLEKRTDRRAEIEEELATKFLFNKAERFVAIPYSFSCYRPGAYGCSMSHICLFRKMILNGWETMMVFEDDAQLLTSREEIDKHINVFLEDNTLDILCIGNSCGDNTPYNELMNRCFNTQSTSCYVIKKKFVKVFLESVFKDPTESMTLSPDNPELHLKLNIIDVGWAPLQKIHYFMMPKIRQVSQRPSYSDIEERFTSYGL
jgi:GR25 family glycosyltransferase involved in LPS biosynthesis